MLYRSTLILLVCCFSGLNIYSQEPIDIDSELENVPTALIQILLPNSDPFDLGDLDQKRLCSSVGQTINLDNTENERYQVMGYTQSNGLQELRVRKIKSGDRNSVSRIKSYGVEYNPDDRTSFHIGVGKVRSQQAFDSISSKGGFLSIRIEH